MPVGNDCPFTPTFLLRYLAKHRLKRIILFATYPHKLWGLSLRRISHMTRVSCHPCLPCLLKAKSTMTTELQLNKLGNFQFPLLINSLSLSISRYWSRVVLRATRLSSLMNAQKQKEEVGTWDTSAALNATRSLEAKGTFVWHSLAAERPH